MNLKQRLQHALVAFKTNNSYDPSSFLKYGRRRMPASWSVPEINDRDFYTGIGYAVINKRANRSVVLGKKFLFTEATEKIMAESNQSGEQVVHPYLKLIRESTEFSEKDFWYSISTYLDLEGVYYLMAVRITRANGTVGAVQKFSLLNPYNVRKVVNSKGDVGGYIEQRNGRQRIIPPEMIIPIKLINPFDNSKPYSLADAARDSQFTLKQANDFARKAIEGNLNAPGILSSSIELPDDEFDNFVERIRAGRAHNGGEPIFANGAGTVGWVDMQADLDKAALDKINTINRDTLLAVSGLSKTGIGIEESGTGREVSRTQKDDFTENAVMPQVENIIDALNLDYRRNYPKEFKDDHYTIVLDNPLETDREAEQADVNIRDSQFALLQALLAAGYDYTIAAKYAKGLIDVTDLGGVPIKGEDETPMGDGEDPNEPNNDPEKSDPEANSLTPFTGYPIPLVQYLPNHADQINSLTESGSTIFSLNESIGEAVRIQRVTEKDGRLIGRVDRNTYIPLAELKEGADTETILSTLNKYYKNQPVARKKKVKQSLDDDLRRAAESTEDDIFSDFLNGNKPNADKYIEGLALPFAVWFTVMFGRLAHERMKETTKSLKLGETPIALTERMKQTISQTARNEATSHVNTIISDLTVALENAKAKHNNKEEIQKAFTQSYEQLKKRRLETLSNTAARRIENLTRYEADYQVLEREGLLKHAYKRLKSITGDPCEICAHLIHQSSKEPIPFTSNFVDKGETIEAGGKKMTFSYEDVHAGSVHPNCHCVYEIVIE